MGPSPAPSECLAGAHGRCGANRGEKRNAGAQMGERRSLRDISTMLTEAGHLNEHGRPFNHRSIKVMVES